MEKCVKCGKDAVHSGSYLIGSKNAFSVEKFEGAAVIGICGECAKPAFKKQINKNLLIALGAFVFGLFMLLTVITDNFGSGASSSVNSIWVIAIIIASLGGSIKFFLAYSVAVKKLSRNDREFIKGMITNEVVVKVLENAREINKDVILNWEVLSKKRDDKIANFFDPAFLTEIRTPFNVGRTGKIVLNGFVNADHIVVPGLYTDKTIGKDGKMLIKQAVECYLKENK